MEGSVLPSARSSGSFALERSCGPRSGSGARPSLALAPFLRRGSDAFAVGAPRGGTDGREPAMWIPPPRRLSPRPPRSRLTAGRCSSPRGFGCRRRQRLRWRCTTRTTSSRATGRLRAFFSCQTFSSSSFSSYRATRQSFMRRRSVAELLARWARRTSPSFRGGAFFFFWGGGGGGGGGETSKTSKGGRDVL